MDERKHTGGQLTEPAAPALGPDTTPYRDCPAGGDGQEVELPSGVADVRK